MVPTPRNTEWCLPPPPPKMQRRGLRNKEPTPASSASRPRLLPGRGFYSQVSRDEDKRRGYSVCRPASIHHPWGVLETRAPSPCLPIFILSVIERCWRLRLSLGKPPTSLQDRSPNVFRRWWPKPARGLISDRKQPRPCFMDISEIKSPGPWAIDVICKPLTFSRNQ